MPDYKQKIRHELKRFNAYRGHYNAITYGDVMELRPEIFQDTENFFFAHPNNFYRNLYYHIKHKADVRQSTHDDYKAVLNEVSDMATDGDPYFKASIVDTLINYTDYTSDRFFFTFDLNNEYSPVDLGDGEYIANFKYKITFNELEIIEKLQLVVSFGYEIHERDGIDMTTMTDSNHYKYFNMWYACLLYQNDLRWNTAFLMRYDIASEEPDEGRTLFFKYNSRYNNGDSETSDSDSDNDSQTGNDHTSDNSDSDTSDNAGLYGMAYYAEEPTEQ